jgi:hypothetical protein
MDQLLGDFYQLLANVWPVDVLIRELLDFLELSELVQLDFVNPGVGTEAVDVQHAFVDAGYEFENVKWPLRICRVCFHLSNHIRHSCERLPVSFDLRRWLLWTLWLLRLPDSSTVNTCSYVDNKDLIHIHRWGYVFSLYTHVVRVDIVRWIVVPEAAVDEIAIANATEGKVARSGRCCLSSIANSTCKCTIAVVAAQIGGLISEVVSFKLGC